MYQAEKLEEEEEAKRKERMEKREEDEVETNGRSWRGSEVRPGSATNYFLFVQPVKIEPQLRFAFDQETRSMAF